MANPAIRQHIEGLVGQTIDTMTGRPNAVLAIEGDSVIVGTERSPEGQPVPIEEIEAAYARLVRDGELEINPESVGYRSAFVGAVLASLPGTEIGARPRRIRLAPAPERPRPNPAWTFDELTLALDLYKRRGQLGDTDPEVIELSQLLNALPIHTERGGYGTFRNPSGVAMKLGNFARLDPAYSGTGLTRGSRRDEEVWQRFDGRPDELHAIAAEIRAGVRSGQGLPLPGDEEEAPEVSDARDDAVSRATGSREPPRRVSAAERRAIELRAMALAEGHYRQAGWEVDDVSASMPFDLMCQRDGSELHVEVKGTTSTRPQVVLTANEVVHARTEHPRTALVWVSEIYLDAENEKEPVATGEEFA